MDTFVRKVVNDGKKLLDGMLDDFIGRNESRVGIGIEVPEKNRKWKKIKMYQTDMEEYAEKLGITLAFKDEKKAIVYKYFR